MTNQEILERSIQKAIDGGWRLDSGAVPMPRKQGFPHEVGDVLAYYGVMTKSDWNKIIFNHDFARSLWPGHKCTCDMQGEVTQVQSDGTERKTTWSKTGPHKKDCKFANDWRYHLQQLAVATDRVKYLGDHLG